LENDVIDTMLAGLKEWRPDLSYPESHSDMQGCVRALLRMYELKRRPLPVPLFMPCPVCKGIGAHIDPSSGPHYTKSSTCKHCNGWGKVPQ
jgi:hypothetical protein